MITKSVRTYALILSVFIAAPFLPADETRSTVQTLSSVEAVNQLLGVRTTGSALSPRASEYIYTPTVRNPVYGSLYGRPNYSKYQSVTSRLKKANRNRYRSIYQSPNATNLFYRGSVGLR
ncbi:MAG: hypothetical protein P1V20_08295 [Verrucomicrobiales bacterium]|nr:hypothetical protein [Verrucomicrobiales bacterium]